METVRKGSSPTLPPHKEHKESMYLNQKQHWITFCLELFHIKIQEPSTLDQGCCYSHGWPVCRLKVIKRLKFSFIKYSSYTQHLAVELRCLKHNYGNPAAQPHRGMGHLMVIYRQLWTYI